MEKQVIISEQKQKRLDRYAELKKQFKTLMSNGGDKTAVIKHIAKVNKVSSATIYKAIK